MPCIDSRLLYVRERRDTVRELETAVELSGRKHGDALPLGYARATAGDCDGAVQIVDELCRRAASTYVSAFEIALICAVLDEVDTAFTRLDRACDERPEWLPYIEVFMKINSVDSHHLPLEARAH